MLRPVLEEVNKNCENWGCNDIQVNLSCTRDIKPTYKLKITSWAKGNRLKADCLDKLPEVVALWSPEEAEKQRKRDEIERLKSELAALETKGEE